MRFSAIGADQPTRGNQTKIEKNAAYQKSNMKLQWVHILTLAQDWLAFSKVHFAPLLPAQFWFEIRLLK